MTVLARTVAGGASDERSLLDEKIDGGTMEQYLKTREEKNAILRWIANGARESEWADVEPVLMERCVSCHNDLTMPNLVPLVYQSTARLATVRSLLAEKIEWGTMERYLEGHEEQEKILRWIDGGAAESGWNEVEPILNRALCLLSQPGRSTGPRAPGSISVGRAVRSHTAFRAGHRSLGRPHRGAAALRVVGLCLMWK